MSYGDEYDGWDPEDEEYDRQLAGLQKAAARQNANFWNVKTAHLVGKKSAKYRKKYNLNEAELAAMLGQDPGLHEQGMNAAAKAYNKTLFEAKKRRGGPQPARAVDQPRARGRRPEAPELDMEKLRQKARTTGLQADEQEAIMDAVLGDLFTD